MIRRISIILAVSVLLLAGFALIAAPQGFFPSDLTLHQTQTSSGGRGGGKPVSMITYMSGNALKSATSDGDDVIFRLDQEKMITVNHPRKTYSEITFQQLGQMADQIGSLAENQEAMKALAGMMGGPPKEVKLEKAGPGEKIAGYATEKYTVTGPMEMQIWAAPDLKVPAQFFEALKARMPRLPMFDLSKTFEEMKKISGMPLKQIVTMKMMGMEITSTTVVDSVDKSPIPKSVFDVPTGYKNVPFMQQK